MSGFRKKIIRKKKQNKKVLITITNTSWDEIPLKENYTSVNSKIERYPVINYRKYKKENIFHQKSN